MIIYIDIITFLSHNQVIYFWNLCVILCYT